MKKPDIPKRYQLLYEETAKKRVFETLMRYPDKEFSLSDLAKEAKVSKTNISGFLEELNSLGLITITKLKVTWRIKANQQNPYLIRNKIIYNLNEIYNSNLVDFLDQTFNHPKSIILFGSYRKGEDQSTSDIDIAIETDGEYKVTGLRELADFEKVIGRKIQLHLFNRKNIDLHLFNNIANGILLKGFLEVRP